MQIPSFLSFVALVALVACSGGNQVVHGTLDTASFPMQVDSISAVAVHGEQVTARVAEDGSFTLKLAPATTWRLGFGDSGALIYPQAGGGYASTFSTGLPGEAFDLGIVRWIGEPGEQPRSQSNALSVTGKTDDEDAKGDFDKSEFCAWAEDLVSVCADQAGWDAYWADEDNGAVMDWQSYGFDDVCNGWLAGKVQWCAAIDEAAVPDKSPGSCIGDCDACPDGDKVQRGDSWFYCKEGTWYDVTDWGDKKDDTDYDEDK